MKFKISVYLIVYPNNPEVFLKASIYQDKYRFIIITETDTVFDVEEVQSILIEAMNE